MLTKGGSKRLVFYIVSQRAKIQYFARVNFLGFMLIRLYPCIFNMTKKFLF